jgi:tetratricopeptide (TPR) repeat protein
LLLEAVSLDPDFAEAWATLAEAEAVAPDYRPVDPDAFKERARLHAQTAIGLNPTLALPHGVMGLIEQDEGNTLAAHIALQKAYEMEPNNVVVLRWFGASNQALGLFDKALVLFERASALDPMSRTDSFNNAVVQFSLGDLDEAERLFEKTRQLQNEIPGEFVADIRYMRGDVEGAIDFFMRLYDEFAGGAGTGVIWSREDAEIFARGMYSGRESDRQAALALEHFFFVAGDDLWYWQVYEHIKIGNFERAFEILEEQPGMFSTFAADLMWLPLERSIEFRQHPDFPALLERFGYFEAWQYTGWPKLCQPDPGTDGSNGQFSCN